MIIVLVRVLEVAGRAVALVVVHLQTTRVWTLCRGGCSGWRVQWMGVVLCNKLVYNSTQITTP